MRAVTTLHVGESDRVAVELRRLGDTAQFDLTIATGNTIVVLKVPSLEKLIAFDKVFSDRPVTNKPLDGDVLVAIRHFGRTDAELGIRPKLTA